MWRFISKFVVGVSVLIIRGEEVRVFAMWVVCCQWGWVLGIFLVGLVAGGLVVSGCGFEYFS